MGDGGGELGCVWVVGGSVEGVEEEGGCGLRVRDVEHWITLKVCVASSRADVGYHDYWESIGHLNGISVLHWGGFMSMET